VSEGTIRQIAIKVWGSISEPEVVIEPSRYPCNNANVLSYFRRAYKTDPRWAVESLAKAVPDMPVWAAIRVLEGNYEVDGDRVSIFNPKENDNE